MSPFTPKSNTQHIALTTTASTAVQISTGNVGKTYRIIVEGTGAVGITYGPNNTVAAPVIPTGGAANGTLVMLGNTIETFTLPPGSWVRAIIGSGTGNMYIISGEGE